MDKDLVLLEKFYNPQTAYIVRGLLDSHGIDSYVFDAQLNSTAWHLQFALGGVRLMVNKHNLERAQEIIDDTDECKREEKDSPVKPSMFRILMSVFLTIVSGAPTPLKKIKNKKH